MRGVGKKRERERDRETERERQRETERETEIERDRDRETEREREEHYQQGTCGEGTGGRRKGSERTRRGQTVPFIASQTYLTVAR